MREDSKVSVCSAYTTRNNTNKQFFHVMLIVVTSFPHTKLDTTLLVLKSCIPERNSMLLTIWTMRGFLRHVTKLAFMQSDWAANILRKCSVLTILDPSSSIQKVLLHPTNVDLDQGLSSGIRLHLCSYMYKDD